MNSARILVTVSVAAVLQGCGTVAPQGHAPWDPAPGHSLFDQIPNWQGAAGRICCGHLTSCEPHQSPRC